MFDLALQILIGFVIGLVSSAIPGASLPLVVTLLGISWFQPEAIVTSEIVGSVLSIALLLFRVNTGTNPSLDSSLRNLYKAGSLSAVLDQYASLYLAIRLVFVVGGLILVLAGAPIAAKTDWFVQYMGVLIFVIVCIVMVRSYGKGVIPGIIGAIALGYVSTSNNQPNAIMFMSMGLLGISHLVSEITAKPVKPTAQWRTEATGKVSFIGLPVGFLASLFYGMSDNVLYELFVSSNKASNYTKVMSGAVLSATSSSISMLMVIGNVGNRSEASHLVKLAGYSGNTGDAAGLLLLSAGLLIIGFFNVFKLIELTSKLQGMINHKVLCSISLVATCALMFSQLGVWALGYIISGVALRMASGGKGQPALLVISSIPVRTFFLS